MGPFANGVWTRTLGWSIATVIATLNLYLIYKQVRG